MKTLIGLCFVSLSLFAGDGNFADGLPEAQGPEQASETQSLQNELYRFLKGERGSFHPQMPDVRTLRGQELANEMESRSVARSMIYADSFMGKLDTESQETVKKHFHDALASLELHIYDIPTSLFDLSSALVEANHMLRDLERALMVVRPNQFVGYQEAVNAVAGITNILMKSSIFLETPLQRQLAQGKENALIEITSKTAKLLGDVTGLLYAKLAQHPNNLVLNSLLMQTMKLNLHLRGDNFLKKSAGVIVEIFAQTLVGKIQDTLIERDNIIIERGVHPETQRERLRKINQSLAAEANLFTQGWQTGPKSSSSHQINYENGIDLSQSIRRQLEAARARR